MYTFVIARDNINTNNKNNKNKNELIIFVINERKTYTYILCKANEFYNIYIELLTYEICLFTTGFDQERSQDYIFFFLRGVYLKNVEKKLEISYILLGTEYNRFNQYYRIFYSKPKHFDLKNYRKVSQIK